MLFIIESIGASTIRMGTIYMIAALGGGNLAEKSGGLLNLTIEGNMLISAFFCSNRFLLYRKCTLWRISRFSSGGGLFALCYGFTVITAKADQMISSLAFNMFAAGMSAYLLVYFF